MNEDYAALLDELEFLCREYMGDDNALEVAACIRVGEIIETLRLVLKPAPAAVPDDVARDAARYRAVRGNLAHIWFTSADNVLLGVSVEKDVGQPYYGDRMADFDAAADALLDAAQKEGK